MNTCQGWRCLYILDGTYCYVWVGVGSCGVPYQHGVTLGEVAGALGTWLHLRKDAGVHVCLLEKLALHTRAKGRSPIQQTDFPSHTFHLLLLIMVGHPHKRPANPNELTKPNISIRSILVHADRCKLCLLRSEQSVTLCGTNSL